MAFIPLTSVLALHDSGDIPLTEITYIFCLKKFIFIDELQSAYQRGDLLSHEHTSATTIAQRTLLSFSPCFSSCKAFHTVCHSPSQLTSPQSA